MLNFWYKVHLDCVLLQLAYKFNKKVVIHSLLNQERKPMSRHTAHNLNLTHPAMLATVLGLGTLNAHAISLEQPSIQSGQHEPLAATINVSNIDANNFNASVAPSNVYSQMGLNQTADIKATFVRTSDTTGKIVLTSSQPIAEPFADVVLNLNNNGKQVIEPQTLLMPMPREGNIAQSINTPTTVVATDIQQDLPIVSDMQTPVDALDDTSQSFDVAQSQGHEPNQAPIPYANEQDKAVLSSIVPDGTNKQINILTEQITRHIYPAGQAPAHSEESSGLPSTIARADMDDFEQDGEQQPADGASYVVQRGDSLWSIATQIAKANQMSITEVMNALHKQNPQAFFGGKMNQLKTDVTLNIPAYEVIPSQKAIQEAISASRKSEGSSTRKSTRSSSSQKTSTQVRSKKVVKPLPRPRVTLVTPSQSGQATGGDRRTDTGGASSDQLVNTLKNTRTKTAETARRVNGLNQELSSAAQKLQLQNQKLAELEARLKALRAR